MALRDIPVSVPAIIIARSDPYTFGRDKPARKLPPLKKTDPKINKGRHRAMLQARRGTAKSAHVNSTRTKWWNALTREEQEIYIKEHPRTKLKASRRRNKTGLRAAKNQHIPITPSASPPPGGSHKIKDLVHRVRRTLNPRQFAGAILARLGGRINHNQQARDANAEADKLAEKVKITGTSSAKNSKDVVHELYGHLVDASSNQIITNVNKQLRPKDKEQLGQALKYAQDHPEQKTPPKHFITALKRVMLFTLVAGAGAALLGPAGVLIVTNMINDAKNKTGGGVDSLAWQAFRGRSLEGDENSDEKSEYDAQEQAVQRIVEYLKKQLKETSDENQRKSTKRLIDQLSDHLDEYQQYEKSS